MYDNIWQTKLCSVLLSSRRQQEPKYHNYLPFAIRSATPIIPLYRTAVEEQPCPQSIIEHISAAISALSIRSGGSMRSDEPVALRTGFPESSLSA